MATRTRLKLMEIAVENKIELTRIQAQHRIQLRQGLRAQSARKAKRMKQWSAVLGRDVSIKVVGGTSSSGASGESSVQGKSIGASRSQSKSASRRGSNGKISEMMQEFQLADASKIMDDHSAEDAADLAMMSSGDLEMQQDNAKKEIHELTSKLRTFRQSNERALEDLRGKQMKESKFKDEESQKYMMVSLTSLISRRNSNGDMMLR
jgi:HAMP domain-containing protein